MVDLKALEEQEQASSLLKRKTEVVSLNIYEIIRNRRKTLRFSYSFNIFPFTLYSLYIRYERAFKKIF